MRLTEPGKIPYRLAISLSLLCTGMVAVLSLPAVQAQDYQRYDESQYSDEYVNDSEEATKYFNSGEVSKAIALFEKALPLAPSSSLAVVYNNLAASYIKRGNYYLQNKQYDQALSDFRMACYYIDYAWPEGVERKPVHEQNRTVAKDDLNVAYHDDKINPADKQAHLDMGKQLRLQGKFKEAVVEYAKVAELDPKNAEAAQAIGDLFNVLNQPEKSKKYYQTAVNQMGDNTKDDNVLVQLGNTQYKTGEVDKAVQEFNKALAVNPNNESALNQLQKIWLDELKFNPTSVLAHANLAGVYQKKKMYAEAQEQYNAAEHFAYNDPKTPFNVKEMIRLNLGTLFQDMQNYQMAQKAYDTVLSADPNNMTAHYYKGALFQQTGNPQGAISEFNRIPPSDPNFQTAQDQMLKLITANPDSTAVASGLKDYAARFSDNADVQAKVGESFHEMKDYNDAATYYQNAIRLNPNMASAYANLGAVYQALNQPEDAETAYKKAHELDPTNTTVTDLSNSVNQALVDQQYQQAVQLQQQGKKDEAKALLEKALATSPDSPEIHSAYGITLQSMGDLDGAIQHYNKAISLGDPKNNTNEALYHYYLGTAYHQKKDLSHALAEYKTAQNLDPTLNDAKEAIDLLEKQQATGTLSQAVDAFNRKRYPDALSLINKAIAGEPGNAMAHYYKGLILNAQNNSKAAVVSYRDAIKYDPKFADAYYALALALDNAKDDAGAKQAFQKFLDLSTTDDDFVRYAKQRVKAL